MCLASVSGPVCVFVPIVPHAKPRVYMEWPHLYWEVSDLPLKDPCCKLDGLAVLGPWHYFSVASLHVK